MRSLSSIARLSSEGFSWATICLAPLFGSTRTNWPSAVSTTQRLPLESKLTAAGTLNPSATTESSALSTSTLATWPLNLSGPYSKSSGPNSKPLRPPIFSMILRGGFTPSTTVFLGDTLYEIDVEGNGRRIEPSVLTERQRVDSGQAGRELLDRPVALARIEIAGEESGPGHGAVGRERDVVGHALRGGNRNLRRAGVAVDLVQRGAGDAAGEQPSGLVDPQSVHAVKCRAGNEFCNLIGLRGSANQRGAKDCCRDSRTECKSARHDVTSPRFFVGPSIRLGRRFGKRNLSRNMRNVASPPASRTTCAVRTISDFRIRPRRDQRLVTCRVCGEPVEPVASETRAALPRLFIWA